MPQILLKITPNGRRTPGRPMAHIFETYMMMMFYVNFNCISDYMGAFICSVFVWNYVFDQYKT